MTNSSGPMYNALRMNRTFLPKTFASDAMKTPTARILGMSALAAAAVMVGCRGDRSEAPPHQFLPDMDDSPKFKPQTKNEFFADGRAMRPVVPGTVPFSRVDVDRDALVGNPTWYAPFFAQRKSLLKDGWEMYEGAVVKLDHGAEVYDTAGKVFDKIAERIPMPVTEDLLTRGEQKFNIYCAACHGYEANGKGMVGVQWTAGTAADLQGSQYKDRSQKQGKDGYVFYVARNGHFDASKTQKMPGYAHALDAADTWAVVAYLRVLQESHSGVETDIPADQKVALEQERTLILAAAAKKAADEEVLNKAKAAAKAAQAAQKAADRANKPAAPAGGKANDKSGGKK